MYRPVTEDRIMYRQEQRNHPADGARYRQANLINIFWMLAAPATMSSTSPKVG